MSDRVELLALYLHLARAAGQRRRPWSRDRFLVLAAAEAVEAGLAPVAACCRQRVLENNAGHLVGRWPTVAEGLADERLAALVKQLRRQYPREKAEHMLRDLGVHLGRERETYYSDLEYAAALLGCTPEELSRRYGG